MITSLLRKMIKKFEKQYSYDASYMHEINNVSSSATIRLLSFQGITNYKGTNLPLWGGAALAATLHGDCGPCAQLMVDRLLELGVEPESIKACLESETPPQNAMGLGFSFAQAVLNDSADLSRLADKIKDDHGQKSLIAAAYAASTYTTYPLLKRALGHAKVCKLVTLKDGNQVNVSNAA